MAESLRVAVINPPYRSPTRPNSWITVPPEGYGGIQWVVANLIDGLIDRGHHVSLLGAPDTVARHPRLNVVAAAEPEDMRRWLRTARMDVIHDHTNGLVGPEDVPAPAIHVSTHHLTGRPRHPRNCVYLSRAQRGDAGASDAAPVIRIPVNVSRYRTAEFKDDFLLFLGRVSPHKGALEAAAFARAARRPLVIAGPTWEPDYRAGIESLADVSVTFLGEVGGDRRMELLSRASAVLVLSQPHEGPWGGTWCEPGATVVSEAAASGTPVVATRNGALAEIVPPVGRLVNYGTDFRRDVAAACLADVMAPAGLRSAAESRWGHRKIAAEYERLYLDRLEGRSWA